MPTDVWLPFDAEPDDRPLDAHGSAVVSQTAGTRIDARDRDGRERAIDPRFNVALEASAGTGKTRILVERYVNLLKAGVDPGEILALTFTRKAATEMRDRILARLREAAAIGEIPPARWRQLRDRTGDVAISTIDAFCLSLLREFPLEADLDPGFSVADETEVPRLVDESLDRALRLCRALARDDEQVALVFAQLGDRRARAGLAALLNHRIAAPATLARYLASGPRDLTIETAARRGAAGLLAVFEAMRGGLDRFLETGPLLPSFQVLSGRLSAIAEIDHATVDPAHVHAAFMDAREHFLTQDGQPRKVQKHKKEAFASAVDWQVHRDLVIGHAPRVLEAHLSYRRDLNVLVARGIWRMYRVAETEYRRTLDAHAVLDFPDLLLRARDLLRQMEEFARSRYRLEARYHHVLVDEFQDTSRAQWDLISLLTESWGEGAGLAHTGALQPSIFIVGDRKQSIYAFRDADVSILREAARHLEMLRPAGPEGGVRRSISRSFRSAPSLLSFVNDLCHDLEKAPARRDAFVYGEEDHFPLDDPAGDSGAIGLLVGSTPGDCAEATAAEIARLIEDGVTVRDRDTGLSRPVRAGDVAILFRARDSHREFEDALERRGLPAYVYKGLGFFDTDEIKDVRALLSYLADPLSNLRAAAWLRSRFVRISDEGLRVLAPALADALGSGEAPPGVAALDADDREALTTARAAASRWRALVDRVPPAELLDTAIDESAYFVETRGPRARQARENLKKMRAMIRRLQNRGYATLDRIVSHIDRLALGDEANAVIDASGAVSLMTVHAAKGLEFPVVFIVNLARGTGTRRPPIRVGTVEGEDASVAVGDFQSSGDDDQAAREREETKRLLYVAVTRARDRLYLSTALKDGQIKPGRGSLAEVLPPSLQACFAEAALAPSSVRWSASPGTVHDLRVCAPVHVASVRSVTSAPAVERTEPPPTDFAALSDTTMTRRSVGDASVEPELLDVDFRADSMSTRLVGTLVHRLLQREGLRNAATGDWAVDRFASLLRTDEASAVDDLAVLCARAAAAYRAFVTNADVRAIYGAGQPLHEVPFSLQVDGHIVHGAIDCLVRREGSVTVLEFKTGPPRPQHQAQADLYRRAAAALFPDAVIDARLVYGGTVQS
jgi:ATP-dependent helicase/nuclease subunit A